MNTGNEPNSCKDKAQEAYAYIKKHGFVGLIQNGWSWLLDIPDRLTAISTFMIFLATAATAGLGIAQWLILSGTLDELRLEQRPWVGTVGQRVVPDFDSPGNSIYFLEIQNTGKFPALNVKITVAEWGTDPGTLNFPIAECAKEKCRERNISIFPNSVESLRIPEVGKNEPRIGDLGHIISRIDYTDQNGHRHRTDMCYSVETTANSHAKSGVAVTVSGCLEEGSNYAD